MKSAIVKVLIGAAVMWAALPLTVHGMPISRECNEHCVLWENWRSLF